MTARIDTPEELVAFRHGGILPVTSCDSWSAGRRLGEGWGELTCAEDRESHSDDRTAL